MRAEPPNGSSTVYDNARFEFGENWKSFLTRLDDVRIAHAEQSLRDSLDVTDLTGLRFLDAGCGSGLFSLAARRLGATVTSFDYDPMSVQCTARLRDQFSAGDDPEWQVMQGSVLDRAFLATLGDFDVIYSWGVLHHTGAMWSALANIADLVRPGATAIVALYNDQGWKSHVWWLIKRLYARLPRLARPVYAAAIGGSTEALNIMKYTIKLQPMTAIRPLLDYRRSRGMSRWHDIVDWVGGFPYEFVDYYTLRDWLRNRGFDVIRGNPASSLGCHEVVFRLAPQADHSARD